MKNLWEMKADVLIVTVNTVGVMGKGLALQAKHNFPDLLPLYLQALREDRLATGKSVIVTVARGKGIQHIGLVATKQHWRYPSKVSWVTEGFLSLLNEMEKHKLKTVAVPPLGCANGGLNWETVKPSLEAIAKLYPQIGVEYTL